MYMIFLNNLVSKEPGINPRPTHIMKELLEGNPSSKSINFCDLFQ
jgi:hypothetical protein